MEKNYKILSIKNGDSEKGISVFFVEIMKKLF